MDFGSFLLSVGTWFVIFAVLVVLFTRLSRKPGNRLVYYPGRILRGDDPFEGGSPTRNPFSWLKEALSSSEGDVIAASGVDSAVYFVFLSTVLKILVLSGVVLLPLLLPLAATESRFKSSPGTFNNLDRLSMAPVNQKSAKLWAFVLATYWVSLVTYFLLWKAYKHVSVLRTAALMSPEFRAENFAVLVRDIPSPPKGQTRKEMLDAYFQKIYPDTFYKSLVVTNNIAEVNKIYAELEGFKKKLAHAEAVYAESKRTGNLGEHRPMDRTGFLGCSSKTIDSTDSYNKKVNELILKLESERTKFVSSENQQPSALVFFTSRVTAASAAQSLHARMIDTWSVMDAPEPDQIIWPNLSRTSLERRKRKHIVQFIIILAIALYMGLIGVISALSTLGVGPGLVKPILKAYLPQIVLIVSVTLISKLLAFLSTKEGAPSVDHKEMATSRKYYCFSALNVFIVFMVLGAVWVSADAVSAEEYDTYLEVLAESLPNNAIFFMTLVALKSLVGYGLELSRIIPLISFHRKRKSHCETGAAQKDAWAPGDLGAGTRIRNDLLIVTIVLGYSVIAPLIIPFGVLCFGLGWLVLRYQVLNVYARSRESYGRMWPHISALIVAALFLFQITMLAYLEMKLLYWGGLALVPLPVTSLIYLYVCWKKFYRFFRDTPLEAASCEPSEAPDMELVYRSFIPRSLLSDGTDKGRPEGFVSHV